jgi:hypothetical protein
MKQTTCSPLKTPPTPLSLSYHSSVRDPTTYKPGATSSLSVFEDPDRISAKSPLPLNVLNPLSLQACDYG